ncbi:MAG: hypothetical protein H6819_08685 [Phycisphaerales bacterium]|nr:hypothetical protein [Phycisphaerales bacterium]MCB9855693.1 hypothetical protein [Phycisphaerales bacterium]MCB9862588.1 hypothetical protein [Phycisphaerales bacterium]
MSFDLILEIAMRWLHILGAITAIGAAIFALVVISPAMAKLPEETRKAFHAAARPKFAMLVGMAIMALLVSGFYNYLVVMRPLHQGQSRYDMLMGIKILLALVVFFIASALTGQSPAFQKIRDNRKFWLTINVLLGAAIVLVAGYLRTMPISTGV